jgi:anti-sigma factor RsiW
VSGDAERISEDELHALVDGQLAEERRAAVERWLQDHPEDAVRLSGWRRQNAALGAAYGAVADEPVPERLRPRLPARRFAPLAAIAASIALFLAGAIAGWFSHGGMSGEHATELRLADRAIAAHRVYAVEVRHPVEVAASDEQHLVTWLSKRLDYHLRLPDLSRTGYRLMGGRLLASESGPAAQFMYEDSAGKRITVYCARVTKGSETAFRFQEAGAINAFYWLDGQVGYAIIGELPRPTLLTIAHSVYDQIEK